MQIVTDIFSVVSSAISNFVTALSSSVNSVVSLFYTAGENGGAGAFTFVGVLTLIAMGTGIVYFAVRFIIRLIKRA